MRNMLLIFLGIFLTSCGSSSKTQEAAKGLTQSQINQYVADGYTYMELAPVANPEPCDFLMIDNQGNIYEVKLGLEDLKQVTTPHILVKFTVLADSEAACTNTIPVDLTDIKFID